MFSARVCQSGTRISFPGTFCGWHPGTITSSNLLTLVCYRRHTYIRLNQQYKRANHVHISYRCMTPWPYSNFLTQQYDRVGQQIRLLLSKLLLENDLKCYQKKTSSRWLELSHVNVQLESYQVHICSSQINNVIRCIQLVQHENFIYNVLIHKQAH